MLLFLPKVIRSHPLVIATLPLLWNFPTKPGLVSYKQPVVSKKYLRANFSFLSKLKFSCFVRFVQTFLWISNFSDFICEAHFLNQLECRRISPVTSLMLLYIRWVGFHRFAERSFICFGNFPYVQQPSFWRISVLGDQGTFRSRGE